MTTVTPIPPVVWRRPRVRPERPRILLVLGLLAAAMPLRIPVTVPVFSSVSLLDLVLAVAALSLLMDLPFRRLNTGPPAVAALLGLPVVAAMLSLAWSQDRTATVSVVVFSSEAFIAYLVVMRELEGLRAERVVRYLEWLVILMIVPAVFLLLGVPGFGVREAGLSKTSGDYLSYFTRLSHPVLGRSNNLATVLVIFVPVLLWWGHVHRRLASIVVGVAGLVAVVATQSRGVAIAAVVSLTIYALVRPIRQTRGRPVFLTVLMATVATFTAAIALYVLNPSTREFATTRLSPANVVLREDLLQVAIGYIRQRPWLGWGPGVAPNDDLRLTVDVHDTYVQQVLSFGVPLGVVVAGTLLLLPVYFFVRSHRTPVASAVALAVLIEVLAFGFESSYEGTVLRVIFYLSIGLLTGLVKADRER